MVGRCKKKTQNSLRDLKVENIQVETHRGHCEKAYIHITRALDSKDKGVEEIFDEIMPEIFSKFMKDTNP